MRKTTNGQVRTTMPSVLPISKSHMPEASPRNPGREHRRSRNLSIAGLDPAAVAPIMAHEDTNMRSRTSGSPATLVLAFMLAARLQWRGTAALRPCRVRPGGRLVMDNFHDVSALDRFAEAVRREIDDPHSPINARAPDGRVDAAIDAVLASLQASHTGSLQAATRSTISRWPTSSAFAIRDDMRRLFPPEARSAIPASA